MNGMETVERMMDRILVQELEAALHLIAHDVELVVLPSEQSSTAQTRRGKEAVQDYFGALGGIVTFWQVRLAPEGERVLVLGRESYTTNAGLESDTEFMLVCELRDGLVNRIVVIENLASEAPLLPTVFHEAARWEAGRSSQKSCH
jgi:hypothetical protein